jgi:cell division protein FtsL
MKRYRKKNQIKSSRSRRQRPIDRGKKAEGDRQPHAGASVRPGTRRQKARRQRSVARIGIVIFFAACFGILLQQAAITSLDGDVRALQSQVKEQQSVNDSLEGKIIGSRNLAAIEAKARKYGMTEPTAKQYVYIVMKKSDRLANARGIGGYLARWMNRMRQ